MTAHLYCWDPGLQLDPNDDDFRDRLEALYQKPKPRASLRLVLFLDALLSWYADLTQTWDTVWGDGPLVNNVRGDFINMSLIWSRYAEAEYRFGSSPPWGGEEYY